MEVIKEQGTEGIIVKAQTEQENEVIFNLWASKTRAVGFERKDGLFSITFAPTHTELNTDNEREI